MKRLDFSTLSKPQKLQVIRFIRRTVGHVNIREIVGNSYQALEENGMLIGTSYKLENPRQ